MTYIVETTGGRVEGIQEDKGIAFLGIPYGVANRFERCQPYSWEGVYKGDRIRGMAPQVEEGQPVGEEDCLSLNVYTPDIDGSYPVLVEIHGGAFQMGSNQWMTPSISREQGIVHIAINYRLGVFGFLSMGVTSDTEGIDTGNLGFDDQQKALRWIYDNCAAFGGDPRRITVMGNSAGGKAIGAHLVSGKVKGILSGVILSSGATQAIRDKETARSLAEEFGQVVLELYGQENGNKSWQSIVKSLTIEELLKAQHTWCDGRQNTCFFGPVADGVLIDTHWIDSWQSNAKPIDRLMLGSNSHECVYYMEDDHLIENRQTIMMELFGVHDALVEEAYNKLLSLKESVSSKEVLMDCLSDYMYGVHTHQLALDCYKEGQVYYYRFGFGNGSHALDMRVLGEEDDLKNEYPRQIHQMERLQENMVQAYRDFIEGKSPFSAYDGSHDSICHWGFEASEDEIEETYSTMDSRMRQVIKR